VRMGFRSSCSSCSTGVSATNFERSGHSRRSHTGPAKMYGVKKTKKEDTHPAAEPDLVIRRNEFVYEHA